MIWLFILFYFIVLSCQVHSICQGFINNVDKCGETSTSSRRPFFSLWIRLSLFLNSIFYLLYIISFRHSPTCQRSESSKLHCQLNHLIHFNIQTFKLRATNANHHRCIITGIILLLYCINFNALFMVFNCPTFIHVLQVH